MVHPRNRRSMRSRLLLGILVPVLALIVLNAAALYRQAHQAADIAYDRTLLASAKSIGETLEVSGTPQAPQLVARVPYAALEAFEADNRSRMVYRVLGFRGELVSGYPELPPVPPAPSDLQAGPYAALVQFHDAQYLGEPVRMAVLLQPVAGAGSEGALIGMAVIQVAETLELRQALARRTLVNTLWSQALLLVVIALVVVVVVQRATRPVREISAGIEARGNSDLAPVSERDSPAELLPLIDAINRVMDRLSRLLAHQKRFVRDASHQLRTPLAVLKTQLQSARRGDVPPQQALAEIEATVDRATELANQMLALAKVEQLRQQDDAPVIDGAAIVRAVVIDLSPLIAARQLDFELKVEPLRLRTHEWALRELVRNLLHNAIKHVPEQGRLEVTLVRMGNQARLLIADDGPGLAEEQRQRLFQAFATGSGSAAAGKGSTSGTGLGLAICHEIVQSLGGRIELDNRVQGQRVLGLDAVVHLPLAD